VATEATLQLAVERLTLVRREIAKIIVGQDDVVEGVLICLLAGGHVLLEGVPGLGKTTLLRTLARTLSLKYSRIQFTPDLMPADIIGSIIVETEEHGRKSLRFQQGPIFANLVLADEINRATPKTQSALLEAMQERTVTSGTTTHELDRPFLVMATQNPIEIRVAWRIVRTIEGAGRVAVQVAATGCRPNSDAPFRSRLGLVEGQYSNSQVRKRCWCSAMSTRLPRKRTPSNSRRVRCSRPASYLSLISPPAPTTRCQGSEPPAVRSNWATWRWYSG